MIETKKIELEYDISTSPKILFHRLSTASGLAEWFADDVNVNGSVYTFIWNGSEELAEMLDKKEGKLVRFSWLREDETDRYFQFEMREDELTGDLALIVTDIVDEDEEEDATELWNSQISELRKILGV